MKKALLFISTSVLFFAGNAQVMWQFNKDTVITWNYQWGDEFNGTSVDETKWDYWYGWARSIFGNKEQQYYSDGKNHKVENGTLKIVARKESLTAKMVDWLPEKDSLKNGDKFYDFNLHHFDYTSGMIKSNIQFTYGFFEIRFKAPKDRGMWPAFWIYGGTPNEEIDIMELKGERPNQIHVDTHCADECDFFKTWYGKKLNWGGWTKLNGNLNDGYNVVAGEWQPDGVKYYVNGNCVAVSKVKFSVKKALVANLALPSNDGPFHPGPAKTFTESEPFEIDYIRVWNLPDMKAKNGEGLNRVTTAVSNLPVQKTKLKKKDKYLYGKKEDHLKDGITVSLFPAADKNYVLYILGMKALDEVGVEVKGEDGRKLFEEKYKEFQNKLDFTALPKGKFMLTVSYGGKKAETRVEL